jgi:hypothetical protein
MTVGTLPKQKVFGGTRSLGDRLIGGRTDPDSPSYVPEFLIPDSLSIGYDGKKWIFKFDYDTPEISTHLVESKLFFDVQFRLGKSTDKLMEIIISRDVRTTDELLAVFVAAQEAVRRLKSTLDNEVVWKSYDFGITLLENFRTYIVNRRQEFDDFFVNFLALPR